MNKAVAAMIAATLVGAPAAWAAPKGSPWNRDYFGNAELTTQDGRKVKFYDDLVEGKIVVVDFVYTHCTKQCGLMTASLARVQRLLGERMGKDIFFYTITLDPDRDTPEVLAQYAKGFRAGPGWTFLTGKKADIAALRKKFGDLTSVEGHAATVNIGNDATGQWMAKGAVDSPQYLATLIGTWMDPAAATRAAPAAAPQAKPAAKVDGKTIWAAKCAACHAEDGSSAGPSLTTVTLRRDRAWLADWIKAPEKLIARRDPTAVELVANYGGAEMPNLDLTAEDVSAVIEHLDDVAKQQKRAGL